MMMKYDNVGRLAFSGTPDEAEQYFGCALNKAYGLIEQNPVQYIKGGV